MYTLVRNIRISSIKLSIYLKSFFSLNKVLIFTLKFINSSSIIGNIENIAKNNKTGYLYKLDNFIIYYNYKKLN